MWFRRSGEQKRAEDKRQVGEGGGRGSKEGQGIRYGWLRRRKEDRVWFRRSRGEQRWAEDKRQVAGGGRGRREGQLARSG